MRSFLLIDLQLCRRAQERDLLPAGVERIADRDQGLDDPPVDAADGNGFGAEMAIFARIAPDADTQVSCNAKGYGAAHCAFMTDHDSVGHWIGTAIEFMARHGVR